MTIERRMGLRAKGAARLAKIVGPQLSTYFGSKLRRPFFMIGCGRSGTTLLTNLLTRHPMIAVYPNEANDLWHADLYPWHRAKIHIAPIWVDPYAFTAHSLSRLQWPRLRSVFGAYQLMVNRPVFLNKSVMLSFMLRDIARNFGDARFIHLYRDGRAVALSYAKKHLGKINDNTSAYESAGIEKEFEGLVWQHFRHWLEHIQAVERVDEEEGLTADGRLLELSYEGLSLDPTECLKRILDFMGLDGEPQHFREAAEIDNRNFKVFEELPYHLLHQLTESGGAVLERKGYAAV